MRLLSLLFKDSSSEVLSLLFKDSAVMLLSLLFKDSSSEGVLAIQGLKQ